MNLYQIVVELIDLRSFSNLWYWIMLAVMWSSASHWVIGVPFDMVLRARRQGGDLQHDLEIVARVQAGRLIYIAETSGILMVAFLCFALTTLGLLSVVYGMEFAQAVSLLVLPMVALAGLSLRTARLIAAHDATGEALHHRLSRHRLATQLLGMVSIFVTSMFGMYQNLHIGALG